MPRFHRAAFVLALSTSLVAAGPALAKAKEAKPAPVADLVKAVDIPYQSFTLDNGLRVIVHEDRKAPVVAVSVWYRAGSKHEPAGKTGFAHLFEHLMFNGSENSPGDFFEPLQQVGATDFNGTTNTDRTNYFETVPTGALDRALFLAAAAQHHADQAVKTQLPVLELHELRHHTPPALGRDEGHQPLQDQRQPQRGQQYACVQGAVPVRLNGATAARACC